MYKKYWIREIKKYCSSYKFIQSKNKDFKFKTRLTLFKFLVWNYFTVAKQFKLKK